MHFVYMVRCSDGTLYTGWTTDVDARVSQHNRGKGAKYTRSRTPVTLCYVESFHSKREALRREREIKGYTRAQKLGMVQDMQTRTDV